MIAVGDIMLGDGYLCPGHGVGSMVQKKGAPSLFEQVAPVLKKGDIVFGNLEAVLSGNGTDSKKTGSRLMRASTESAEGFKFAGFNVLSLANNHILEHGETAVRDTKDILSACGIRHVGVGESFTGSRQPVILNLNGIKIAALAYCLIPDKTAFISTDSPEQICSDVRKAKTEADLTIVSMHWGNEFIERPSAYQVSLAHRILDSGADVILGHHPHVLQGIETYRHGLVAYSLGNFIFDMGYIEETRNSVILDCRLSRHGVDDYILHPLRINRCYCPVMLDGEDKARALMRLEQLSSKPGEEDTVAYAQEYEKRVTELRKSASRRMMKYFLMNIYRYPLPFIQETVINYFKKSFK